MKQDTLLAWYGHFEKLITRLPGPIQNAILGEIQPVKELFLEQRPPRIAMLGTSGIARDEVVNSLFREHLPPLDGELPSPALVPGWETFRRTGRGALQILDGRGRNTLQWQVGPDSFAPDVILFLHSAGCPGDVLTAQVQRLHDVMEELELRFKSLPAVLCVSESGAHPGPEEILRLENALRSVPVIHQKLAAVLPIKRWSRFRADGSPASETDEMDGMHRLLSILIDELPVPAKLEMARITGVQSAQKKIADTLIKAVTAVSAAIGAQPIPLADFPVLTALQSGMVAGIIYISGGELNTRSGLKFLGALGVNIGVGLLLRESARAAAKLVPGWGYLISSAVAAGGTATIGRAASGFFIDGVSIEQARTIFQRHKKSPAPNLPKIDDK